MKKIVFVCLLTALVIGFTSLVNSKQMKKETPREISAIPMLYSSCGYMSPSTAQTALDNALRSIPRQAGPVTSWVDNQPGTYFYCYYIYLNPIIF